MSRARPWLILGVLLLTSCELCPAAPCPPCGAGPGCQSDACSNDPRGVLDDQCLCWDPVATATQYDVCREDESACVTVTSAPVDVGVTSLLASNELAVLKARACNCADSTAPCGCGEWGIERVSFRPYACVRSLPSHPNPRNPQDVITPACEYPCAAGHPYRLSGHVPPCS